MVTKPVRLTEIAAETKLSADTLYDLARAGHLPAFKIGVAWYIHPDDWDRWLREQGAAARAAS